MAIWKTKWGWRAEFELNGERVKAKGFFQLKTQAREWVRTEKERRKENLRRFSSIANDLSLWALSQKYLADCQLNYSKKTLQEKTYCLRRFYEFTGDVQVMDISPPQVLEFLNARAKAQSNGAANKDRKNIKAFYRWIQEIYGVMHDPTGPIRKKAHTKKDRRLIPIADILKVMMLAQGQDRVLLGAYWHTGARKSEVFRWTWADDINFEERWVRLGTKKSRDGSMVYERIWMNNDLYSLLQWQWKNRLPSSPYVFCNMDESSPYHGQPFTTRRRLLKGLCERAEVEPFGFHDIRHTVAKYLNDLQKVGLKKVQQVLRHRKQTTTEIYVEGNYTDTREAVALLELDKVKNFV
ncbi:Site-specific recombinase XerD [Desulfatibacillum alkenivorans DSM 16219]|jgi:integrase|uniref:Site-specific recombinase XerD n=2 Tax=Desulfatibacillum alkenivorans TaxID=259354 RepID=A0A1M6RQJ7_9BACT|nr:Site-specific recombinase XerD [Desulfatibacillum alkenivorans DSM 16219]